MRKILVMMMLCFLPSVVSCISVGSGTSGSGSAGSTSGSNENTPEVAAVMQSKDSLGAIMVNKDGEMLLPLVSNAIPGSSGTTEKIVGALWTNATGGNVAVFFGADGLPYRTVMGDFILLFSNWDLSAGTVDIAKIYVPTDYVEVFRRVSVPAEASNLITGAGGASAVSSSSASTKSTCFPACDSDVKNLAELLKFAGLGISVGACGVATTVSLGAMALPCAGVIVTTATVVMGDETWLENLGDAGSILTGVDVFKCTLGDAGSCVSAALDVSSNTLDSAVQVMNDGSGLVTMANTYISPGSLQQSGVVSPGAILPTCPNDYQCTPGSYMPCYPDGTKQCGTGCTWGACPASTGSGGGNTGGGNTGGNTGGTDCTCYCDTGGVCTSNSQCPPDTSVPGTSVPGVCGCPVGC